MKLNNIIKKIGSQEQPDQAQYKIRLAKECDLFVNKLQDLILKLQDDHKNFDDDQQEPENDAHKS